MKLTPFGKSVRIARIELNISLKEMADFLQLSSPMLSSIEYGERRLTRGVLDKSLDFLKTKNASEKLIKEVLTSGEQSMTLVETGGLNEKERGLVAAFARRLTEDGAPPIDVTNWLRDKK